MTDDSPSFDKEAILRKIASLQALVNHESTEDKLKIAALTRIKILTDKYSISLSDMEKADAYEITESYIRFSNPLTKSRFYLVSMCMQIADLFNIRLLTLGYPGSADVYGFRLIGTDIDIQSSMIAISYIISESKNQLQLFYKAVETAFEQIQTGYETAAQNESLFSLGDDQSPFRYAYADRVVRSSYEKIEEHSSSTGSTQVLDYYNSPEYKAMVTRIAAKFFIRLTDMPDISDIVWLDVEVNWGIGFNSRFGERLKTELAETDSDDSINENLNDVSPPIPNLPVRVSTDLAVISETVRKEKLDRINDYVKNETIHSESVFIVASDREVTSVGGSRSADQVDLSSLRKKQ